MEQQTEQFIGENGGKRGARDRAERLLNERGVSLSVGMGLARRVACNGYVYREAHIDSCCQLRGGWAIRLTEGQRLQWHTRSMPMIPAYYQPVDTIQADAAGGAILVWEYAMGNGAAYPQPGGYFELSADGEPLISFSLKKDSHLYEKERGVRLYLEVRRKKLASPGESFTLDSFVRDESIYINGIAYLYLPQSVLRGREKLTLCVKAHNADGASRRWFRIGYCFQILDCDLSAGIETVLSPKKQRSIDNKPVYFGDIHIHTGQTESLHGNGCGRKSVRHNLTYARDIAGLDFCAITDHDWQLDAEDWHRVREENDRFNRDGQFVALHAYEWTSGNYGHRNVYFCTDTLPKDLAPFDFQAVPHKLKKYGRATPNDPTPSDLWQWLDALKTEAMTIPHHPNAEQFPLDFYRFFNERYDRCVEVYSNWGCFLPSGKALNLCCDRIDALDYTRYAGKLHFGFLASSDGHDSNAGEANLTKPMRQMAHYAGSGRVAVFADALTRKGVFDAIYNRRCYATTGAPILLTFSIDGFEMGAKIHEPSETLRVRLHVIGTEPIARVTLYRNTEPIQTAAPCETAYEMTSEIEAVSGAYYVAVEQTDGEYAWSSPILYAPEANQEHHSKEE
ncbi:MAG: DUF3604 domain-containing protein [Clostridia bacterium]|nr:DUF3604 domain-containing protein [Clostridia bacterium]